jgi:hypothetical protein
MNLGDFRCLLERAEIETHGDAAEEMRCGGDSRGQLVLNGVRVRSTDAHLHQTNLAVANVDDRPWCVNSVL